MQKDDDEFLKRLIIADASFLTTQEKLILQNNIDTSAMLALSSIEEISFKINRVLKKVSWNGQKYLQKAKIAKHLVETLGIKSVCIDDQDFPVMLKEMPDSPYMIFYRGNLDVLKKKCVSVVGTRTASLSAKKAAQSFACDGANEDCCIVSGLAYGIDGCAHKGALNATRGATCAVLPGGIDTIYPRSHVKLATQILQKGGLLISEYTPGTPAQSFRFVQRDRLIAALSSVTVVIQAPCASGALLTAQFALDYGRDVMFHSVAFNEESKFLDEIKFKELKILSLTKDVSSKMENTVEKYLNDGAPIIENFAQYIQMLQAKPGTVFCKKKDAQLKLSI